MQFSDCLTQSQTESGTALSPGTGFVYPVKGFCNAGQFLRLHTAPCIGHGNQSPFFCQSSNYQNVSAVVYGLFGIVNEINDQGLYKIRLHQAKSVIITPF